MGDDPLFSGDAPTRSVGPTIGDVTGVDPAAPALFGAGDTFGPYRVVRLLGRGGMGEVYEVEDRENARRVALKVLNNRLSPAADRARFIREGRLAAGISHANTVYVYGTDDIDGIPVIAMELVPGGTLKDRVKIAGSLRPSEAVDAILQVIAGLEAAADAGVLHRDIKPSNCFVDGDGTVKVGDFGLSISTQTFDERSLTMLGTVLGTPGFSSPEQMRGDEVDVRSDIYAVGGTLYYLLTGKPPFDDPNVIRLVTQVAQEMPASPRAARPDVPGDLADVVMRCLAKKPGDRYQTYAELRAALEPFSSSAPLPAPLGVRFGAGVLDNIVLTMLTVPAASVWWDGMRPTDVPGLIKGTVSGWLVLLLYYGISEGAWGRSLGKQLFGLRVVDLSNHRPGIPRGMLRAGAWIASDGLPLLAYSAWLMPVMSAYENTPIGAILGLSIPVASLLLVAAIFSTARRRNGFAAVHDLVTGSRVVLRRRSEDRLRTAASATAALPISTRERIGPYLVLDERPQGVPDLVTGYDDRLRRRVWIHLRRPGDPQLPESRRTLARPGRLRWLGGRRTAAEAWDAFEAPEGVPLTMALETRPSWAEVRYWLLDLAKEIRAAQAEAALPHLSLDRVWIAAGGRARLLDWGPDAAGPLTPTAFLARIARSGGTTPLPLHARAFLARLEGNGFDTLDGLVRELAGLIEEPAAVRRGRRVAHLLVSVMPAGALAVMMLVVSVVLIWAQSMPGGTTDLTETLRRLDRLRTDPAIARRPGEERALEVYIASHYAGLIRDDRTWTGSWTMLRFDPALRRIAEQTVSSHPSPSSGEVAAASAIVEPFLEGRRERARQRASPRGLLAIAALFAAAASVVMACVGLLSALLFRGGLMLRLFGIAIAISAGEAGRLRALWRAVIAWSPAALALAAFVMGRSAGMAGTTWQVIELVSATLFAAGFAYAIRHPERGLQDRLAGTWLVPR